MAVLLRRKYSPVEPDYKVEPIIYEGSDNAIKNVLNCVNIEKLYVGPGDLSCVLSPLVSKYIKTFKQPYFLTSLENDEEKLYVYRNLRLSDFWDSEATKTTDKTIWIKNLTSLEYGPEITKKNILMCKKTITDVSLYGYDKEVTMTKISSTVRAQSNKEHYDKQKIILCKNAQGQDVAEVRVPINLFTNLRSFIPTKSLIIVEKNGRRYSIDIFVDYNKQKSAIDDTNFNMSFGTATKAQAHYKQDYARASSCMELFVEKYKMTLNYINLEASPFFANPDIVDEADFNKRNTHCAKPLDGSSETFDYRDWADIGRQFALSFGQMYSYKLLDHMSVPYGTLKYKYEIRKHLNDYKKADVEIQYLSVSRIKLFLQGTTSYEDSMGVLPVFQNTKRTLHPLAYKAYGKLLKKYKCASIPEKYATFINKFINLKDFELVKDLYKFILTSEKNAESIDRVNNYKHKLFDNLLNPSNEELAKEVIRSYINESEDNRYFCSTFWWVSCRPTRLYLETYLPVTLYEEILNDALLNDCFYDAFFKLQETDTKETKLLAIKEATLKALESFDPMNCYYVTNDFLKVYKPNGLPKIIEWKLN